MEGGQTTKYNIVTSAFYGAGLTALDQLWNPTQILKYTNTQVVDHSYTNKQKV